MSLPPADWTPANPPAPAPAPYFSRSPLDAWLGGIQTEESPLTEPLRFHLWELMVTITVAAVLLGLFRAVGIYGAALAFFAAVAFTNLAYPKLNARSPARQAAMFDFIWGAIMPLVCLAFDPFVFKYGDTPLLHEEFGGPGPLLFRSATIHPWSWPVYAIIAWQIACLGVWLVAGRLPAALAAVWAGMLWVGFGLAVVVGVLLIVPATAGAFAGIGFLGFTPLFTARTFYRRALMAGKVARRELPSHDDWLLMCGVWAALLIPGTAGVLLGMWLTAQPGGDLVP